MISSSLVLLLAVISRKFSLLSVRYINLLIKSLLTVFKHHDLLLTGIIWLIQVLIHMNSLSLSLWLSVLMLLSLSTVKSHIQLQAEHTAWIRQPAGKALEWIGYIRSNGDLYYKDSLKSKFSITRDTSSNTITLQGKNMQAEDTAVYYCARETQWHTPTASLYKHIIFTLQYYYVFTTDNHWCSQLELIWLYKNVICIQSVGKTANLIIYLI